jgi:hypothetical protein
VRGGLRIMEVWPGYLYILTGTLMNNIRTKLMFYFLLRDEMKIENKCVKYRGTAWIVSNVGFFFTIMMNMWDS